MIKDAFQGYFIETKTIEIAAGLVRGFERLVPPSLSLSSTHRIDWIFIESRFLISLQLFGMCTLLSYPLAGGRAKTYGGADYWAAYTVKYNYITK